MPTFTNATLLYDADCPLCRVYTGAFTRWGFLDRKNGRAAFQTLDRDGLAGVDTARAQSEIALFDREAGVVRYGLDSLFAVLGHRFPIIPRVGNFPPVRWALTRLYRFISYSRKVIAAVRPAPGAARSCVPAFSAKYRLVYLLLAVWAVASVLRGCGVLTQTPTAWMNVLATAAGPLLVSGVVAVPAGREKVWDCLGHGATVTLIGALLLLPLLWLQPIFGAQPVLYALYAGMVAGAMLTEHVRRMRLVGLGVLPSIICAACWVLAVAVAWPAGW